jgi:hypothetical protein
MQQAGCLSPPIRRIIASLERPVSLLGQLGPAAYNAKKILCRSDLSPVRMSVVPIHPFLQACALILPNGTPAQNSETERFQQANKQPRLGLSFNRTTN